MHNQQFVRIHQQKQAHLTGRLKIKHGLFVIVLFLILFGLNSFLWTNSAKASTTYKQTHRLKPLVRHKIKAVCGRTKQDQPHCMAEVSLATNGQPLVGTPATTGSFGPAEFHTAYNLPCTPGGTAAAICSTPSSFGPETIAVVDAGNFSSGSTGLVGSLQTYDQYYGIPACNLTNGCLNVINQSGTTSPLPPDAGWSDEIALDIETAHMICQTCKILLVEATDATATNLSLANNTAATFGPVSISNSWGDSVDNTSLDADFNHPGIAEVAATGDSGTVSSGASWPSDIPNVVSVAGTTLQINNDNTWANETVWSGSGGGCSNYYAAPSWQQALSDWSTNGCGAYRSFGDVSADGDPNSGAAIYIGSQWYEYGGTSLSTPIIASIFALTGGLPSNAEASNIPYAAYTTSNFHDITIGNDCVTVGELHCTAGVGFDNPSGLGSPDGIAGFMSLPSQPLNVSAITIDQNHIDLNWSASNAIQGISGYYVYRNGNKIATVTTTSYNDSGLTPNTTYQYDVVAYDTQNNDSLASSTITAISSYPADINQDGHIDLLDLSILASKYGQSGSNLGRADINRDGVIDILDLSILAAQYNTE